MKSKFKFSNLEAAIIFLLITTFVISLSLGVLDNKVNNMQNLVDSVDHNTASTHYNYGS